LKISDLFFEEGLLKSLGKGSSALFLLEAWLRNTSIFIKAPLDSSERKEEHGDVLFLNREEVNLQERFYDYQRFSSQNRIA
jgi:hypothetical protein